MPPPPGLADRAGRLLADAGDAAGEEADLPPAAAARTLRAGWAECEELAARSGWAYQCPNGGYHRARRFRNIAARAPTEDLYITLWLHQVLWTFRSVSLTGQCQEASVALSATLPFSRSAPH